MYQFVRHFFFNTFSISDHNHFHIQNYRLGNRSNRGMDFGEGNFSVLYLIGAQTTSFLGGKRFPEKSLNAAPTVMDRRQTDAPEFDLI